LKKVRLVCSLHMRATPSAEEGDPGGRRRPRLHHAPDRACVVRLLFGQVARNQILIYRNMVGEEMAQAFNVVPPVAMQLTDDGELVH
jgi:hypothetical protein